LRIKASRAGEVGPPKPQDRVTVLSCEGFDGHDVEICINASTGHPFILIRTQDQSYAISPRGRKEPGIIVKCSRFIKPPRVTNNNGHNLLTGEGWRVVEEAEVQQGIDATDNTPYLQIRLP
jgi:hypothetical protein